MENDKVVVHKMYLKTKPYEMVKSGRKTIELRLYDDKRRKIKGGDKIEFSNMGMPNEKLIAKVCKLHIFDSFKELYEKLPLLKCGYRNDNLDNASYKDMEQYYPTDLQEQFGVIGIEIKMIDNIEWLFFDIGSTLVDERIAYEHRFRDIAEAANTTYENVYNMALDFYKRNVRGDLQTAVNLGVVLPKWHTKDEMVYEESLPILAKLKEKYKIGIIANQSLGAKERLADYGILPYVDLVIASAEEGVSKPDKEIFEIALARSGCSPENAIMVGDRVDNDIIPANRMGMHTIWIKQGLGQYWTVTEEVEKADYVIDNLHELLEIL